MKLYIDQNPLRKDTESECIGYPARNWIRPRTSVVEPLHFGPAPASQDGGFGSSCSSVVHNLLQKKSLFLFFRFHFSIYRSFLFKVRSEGFALLFQYCS